jgi:hypothetical protein
VPYSIIMGKKAAALVAVTLLATAFWVYVLYAEVHTDIGEFQAPRGNHTGVTNVVVVSRAGALGIEIGALPADSELLVDSAWEHKYTAWEEFRAGAVNVTYTNETIGDTFYLYIDAVYDATHVTFLAFRSWSFYLNLHPAYVMNVSVAHDVGSVAVDLTSCTLACLDVATTTGSTSIRLTDCELSGPLRASTTTGGVDVTLINSSVAGDLSITSEVGSTALVALETLLGSDANISSAVGSVSVQLRDIAVSETWELGMTADVGSIVLEWDQTIALGADVSLRAEATGTGSVGATLALDPALFRIGVSAASEVGSVSIEGETLESVGTDAWQSGNYAGTGDLVTLVATANVGSVRVAA